MFFLVNILKLFITGASSHQMGGPRVYQDNETRHREERRVVLWSGPLGNIFHG